jgi:hypothetical protein
LFVKVKEQLYAKKGQREYLFRRSTNLNYTIVSVGLQGSCILTPNYDFGVADDYSVLLGYYSDIEHYKGSLLAYLGYTYVS